MALKKSGTYVMMKFILKFSKAKTNRNLKLLFTMLILFPISIIAFWAYYSILLIIGFFYEKFQGNEVLAFLLGNVQGIINGLAGINLIILRFHNYYISIKIKYSFY